METHYPYMCHCCASCFRSAEDLLEHIQDQQSLLYHNVQALRRMPQASISDVLEILLQHATHAAGSDPEQHLKCPEPRCDYASSEGYQSLQRHYLQHVTCVLECPFCCKPLKSVSGVARHPDICKDRSGRSIPADLKKRRIEIVQDAYARLRLAQNSTKLRRKARRNRVARRHPSQGSSDRASHPSDTAPLSNTNTRYNAAVISGTEGKTDSITLPRAASTTTTISDPTQFDTFDAVNNCFSEIGHTSMRMVDDSTSTYCGIPLQELVPAPAPMLTGAPTYSAGVPSNSIDIQRALSLSHTADGISNYATEQCFSATGADPPYQAGFYLQGHVERALSLSYTMDGTVDHTAHYLAVPGTNASYRPEVFSAEGDANRSSGIMYPADGSTCQIRDTVPQANGRRLSTDDYLCQD